MRKLRINLKQEGVEKVDLKLPAQTLGIVHELMPEKALQVLKEKEIDLEVVRARAKEATVFPCPLLEVEWEQKVLTIWIE